jgi:hypothetical protein
MQTLRLLDVADLAEYDQYFIIGTTALGGPDGSYGRVWY